ncbi:hypothetical protein [Rhodobacter flavimaris]|nr:hypothetical protein [Sinirhodobacter sp. WL0062]
MKHHARRLFTDHRLIDRSHRAMFAIGIVSLAVSISAMALRLATS